MASLRVSFYEGQDSFMSRLDPRVKLTYVGWVFAMIMVFSHPLYQAFTFLTILIAIWAGKLSLRKVISAGKFGIYVGIASFVLWIIFLDDSGVELFTILGRSVTDLGVLMGLSVAFRVTSVLFSFLIVAMTTPTRDIITGLYGLKISLVFSMVVGIVLRLIPQFQSEHHTIVEAQKSRGTEFDKGGLITRFRKHTSYVIPLTLRALKIVSDLSIAMDSRAFDPYAERTFVRQTTMKPIDRTFLAIMAFTITAGIGLRIAGLGGVGDGTFVGQ